jgi:2-polyprenyl-3-methyl-5-hydroxy-6-metoxy-1,4-benzoquinol methylase
VTADFSRRSADARELMDDPACDKAVLFRTYRHFKLLNRLFSRWHCIYRRHIRPHLEPGRSGSVLDIGFGGGDIARDLVRWAKKDGLELRVVGIDTDERALRYVRQQAWPSEITFLQASASDLGRAGDRFDFVISNHVLHHLDGAGIARLSAEAEALAARAVLFNDLVRSKWAYRLFGVFGFLFLRGSFAAPDGQLSILRGFTREELLGMLPAGWDVERLAPYRLLAVHKT